MDTAILSLKQELANKEMLQFRARRLVEDLAMTYQGALLLSGGRPEVTEAFLSTRLTNTGRRAFGTLPTHLDVDKIIAGYMP